MARGNQAYLDHLKKVALFSACNNKELQRIARSGTEIKVPEGYKLTDQGQLGNQAFVDHRGHGHREAQRQEGGPARSGHHGRRALAPRPRPPHGDGHDRRRRHGVRHRPAQLHGGARRRAGAVAQAAGRRWPVASATSTASTTAESVCRRRPQRFGLRRRSTMRAISVDARHGRRTSRPGQTPVRSPTRDCRAPHPVPHPALPGGHRDRHRLRHLHRAVGPRPPAHQVARGGGIGRARGLRGHPRCPDARLLHHHAGAAHRRRPALRTTGEELGARRARQPPAQRRRRSRSGSRASGPPPP